jgi:hypothetical protein
MKILDRLSGGLTGGLRPGGASAAREVSFRSHLRRLSPLRAASWRQLLRVNREAQVDPLIGPPTPPPGYSASDPVSERNQFRASLDRRMEALRSSDIPPALSGRKPAVERMLALLQQQQRQQDMISAHSARAAAEWK